MAWRMRIISFYPHHFRSSNSWRHTDSGHGRQDTRPAVANRWSTDPMVCEVRKVGGRCTRPYRLLFSENRREADEQVPITHRPKGSLVPATALVILGALQGLEEDEEQTGLAVGEMAGHPCGVIKYVPDTTSNCSSPLLCLEG